MFSFNSNAQDGFGLGSFSPGASFTALFHPGNDNQLLQQQLDAANQNTSILAGAELTATQYAAQQQSETMITIAAIIGAVLFLFIILWFLKS